MSSTGDPPEGGRGQGPVLTPSGWDRAAYGSFSRFIEAIASVRRGRLFEADGVIASINRATPEHSLFNSVLYESHEQLLSSIDELRELYRRAGVLAWTVWAPIADHETGLVLAERGHRLDGEPHSMTIDLASLPEPDQQLEFERGIEWNTVWRIADQAYGMVEGSWASGLGGRPDRALHSYGAFHEGWIASVLTTLDHGDDCGIYAVATLPEARGNRLATRLLHQALWEARERGRLTASLQSTSAALPVYRRLGFIDCGEVGFWEHRIHPS